MPAIAHLLSIPAAVALSAWQLVGISAPVTVTATGHTLTEPAGVQQGDLLVACIASRIASTTSITLPSGWTRVNESKTNNVVAAATTGIASACMAFIERGASAPALGFTHPTAPSVAMGSIIAYRYMQPASAVDVSAAGVTATNTTSVSIAGMTPTLVEDLIVGMMAGGQAAAWSNFRATDPATGSGATDTTTAPTAGTFRERGDNTTTTGADTSLGIFDATKSVAGATGNFLTTASLGAGHALVAGAFKRNASALDPNRKGDDIVLSVGNRKATRGAGTGLNCFGGVHGASKGKWYYELTVDAMGGSGGNYSIGVATAGRNWRDFNGVNSWLGFNPGEVGFYPRQNAVYHTNASIGSFTASGVVPGNIIGCAYDLDLLLIWYHLQSGNWNGSGTANPATGVGGFSMANLRGIVVPAFCFFEASDSGTINTGNAAFQRAIPTGFRPAGGPP